MAADEAGQGWAGTVEPSTSDLSTAWRGVVADLQPNQRAWLRASEPVTLHESTAIIAVPNDFTRTQLEGRLRGQLEDALTVAFGREIRIAVTVNPQLEDRGEAPDLIAPPVDTSPSRPDDMSTNLAPLVPAPVVPTAAEPAEAGRPTALETRLNPKYTFETFVIGSSNRFPHAAAVAV